MQTSIAIGWIREPHAYVKYNDFVTFSFDIFYNFLFQDFFSQSRSGRTERRTNMHDGSNDAV
jgi:hypothetical protein